MDKEVRMLISEASSTTNNTEGSGWSVPLLWGLVLGAFVAVAAAVRHWLRTAPKEAAPQRSKPIESSPLPALPLPDPALPPEKPAEGKAFPAMVAGSPPAKSTSGQPAKAQKTGSTPSESPEPVTTLGQSIPPSYSRWQEPTKYIVGGGLSLAVLFLLYISRSVIPTVIVAALLALIVHPVIGFFQRRLRLRRGLSIALTYLLIVSLLILIPLILVPSIINAVNDLASLDFQAWAESAAQSVQNLSGTVAGIPVVNWLLTPLLDSISTAFQGVSITPTPETVSYDAAMGGLIDSLARTLGLVASVLGPVVSAVVSIVFMLLISLHLSLSGQRMMEGFPDLLPPRYAPELTALARRLGEVWVSFLRGQFALMAIIGVLVWLGNAILGNRYPLLLGLISGTLEIIPNLGPALALIPGVSFALIFGSNHFAMEPLTFALIVLVFYLLVQVFENQVIVPYVLGGELDVPPLAVILGVMIGGTVAGILGVLLATPFIASGREVFRYLYDKILETPEETAPEERQPSFLDTIGKRIRSVRLPFRGRSGPTPGAIAE
jgi:predicted PurR-regulated permease PerM